MRYFRVRLTESLALKILELGDLYFFSELDLSQGFHQIEIIERDRKKTVFIKRKVIYQYNKLPIGLKDALSALQRAQL